MQMLIQGGSGGITSYMTFFTTPYAAVPSSLYPIALTASSHDIIIPQLNCSSHLPLSNQPPRSPSPIRQSRLRRPGLYLVPLTELPPELHRSPWHYGS